MEKHESFQLAKEGDHQAFVEWSRFYQMDIAKFGFQTGVPTENLAEFQKAVFGRINEQIGNIEEKGAEKKLILIAIETTAFYKTNILTEHGNILKFEEDLETHQALQELSDIKLFPFVLHQFHGKSLKEVGALLGESEGKMQLFIDSAKDFLAEKLNIESKEMVGKRLELLNKSYSRMSVPFFEDLLFQEEPQEEEVVSNDNPVQKQPVNKGVAVMLTVAGLFLTGVVGATFIINDSNQEVATAVEGDGTMVTDRMVDDWKKEIKQTRENSPKLMGIDKQIYENFGYIQEADTLMVQTFSKENIKKLKEDPQEMQYQVDFLKFYFDTPKGMREALSDRSIKSDDTQKFVSLYLNKTEQLMAFADGMLDKYMEELSSITINGKLSAKKLKSDSDNYAEELKRLLNSLHEQTLRVEAHPNEEKFRTVREMELFYNQFPFNNDEDGYYIMQYMELLGRAPYFDETGFLYPIQELSYLMVRLEMFLMELDENDLMYGDMASIFQHTFYMLLKGDEHNSVFDRGGVVKSEYKELWKEIAYNGQNPMTFLLMPIIEEMEESGWTHSDHYEQLAYSDILTVLNMEVKGKLAEQMPNGDVAVKSEVRNMENFEYAEMEGLYKRFKKDYDQQILSELPPLDVLLLYQYANKVEDPETMWHLFAEDGKKPSLKEYVQTWIPQPDLKEEFSSLEVVNESVMRRGYDLYLNVFGNYSSNTEHLMGGQNIPTLITASDHIWLVKYQISERHTISEVETEFSDRVRTLYASINSETVANATPGEIAGLYLLAIENEDLETIKLLLAEPEEGESTNEQFESRHQRSYLPKFSELSRLSFSTESYGNVSEKMTGIVEFEFIKNETVNGNMIWMIKEDGSWRINERTNY